MVKKRGNKNSRVVEGYQRIPTWTGTTVKKQCKRKGKRGRRQLLKGEKGKRRHSILGHPRGGGGKKTGKRGRGGGGTFS